MIGQLNKTWKNLQFLKTFFAGFVLIFTFYPNPTIKSEEAVSYFEFLDGPFVTVDVNLQFLKWPGPLFVAGCLGSGWGEEHGKDTHSLLVSMGKDLVLFEIEKIYGPVEDYGLGEGEFNVANIIGGFGFDEVNPEGANFILNGGAGTAAIVFSMIDFLKAREFILLQERTIEEVLSVASNQKCTPPHFFLRWSNSPAITRQTWLTNESYDLNLFKPTSLNVENISVIGFFESKRGSGETELGVYPTLFGRNFLYETKEEERVSEFLKIAQSSLVEEENTPHCPRDFGKKEIHVITLDFLAEKAGYLVINLCQEKASTIADFYVGDSFVASSAEMADFMSGIGIEPQ